MINETKEKILGKSDTGRPKKKSFSKVGPKKKKKKSKRDTGSGRGARKTKKKVSASLKKKKGSIFDGYNL